MLDLEKVHFYLVSNNTPAETIFSSENYSPAPVYGGAVRVVCCKFPQDSVICSEHSDSLTEGERLRVMRLCAGFTIDEAAGVIGVDRGTIMNYELDGFRRMKRETLHKLYKLYLIQSKLHQGEL